MDTDRKAHRFLVGMVVVVALLVAAAAAWSYLRSMSAADEARRPHPAPPATVGVPETGEEDTAGATDAAAPTDEGQTSPQAFPDSPAPTASGESSPSGGAPGSRTQTSAIGGGGFYPSVAPSEWYIVPGGTVVFAGSGFMPGELVRVGGAASAEVRADSAGSIITPAFIVPHGSGEWRTYALSGASSGASVSVTIRVAVAPAYLLLSTYYAPAGTALVLTGRQFGAHELVEFQMGDRVLGAARANAEGSAMLAAHVPSGAAGDVSVSARGLSTGKRASAHFVRAP